MISGSRSSLPGASAHGIRVRSLVPEDLSYVMELERQGHPHPWPESTFADCFRPDYRLWAAESNGALLGYAVVAYMVDDAHLLNICVSPDARGQGVGRLLLNYLIDAARNDSMDQVILEVRVSNYRAIALYLSEGFVEIGRRAGYYPDGAGREDARVMAVRFT
ncbi:ribosomal protein S18-alanine N-acetyltransferase [Marinobacter sp. VGCF2001]|uniref:ribosomal protein S18-alanine N-acetyltransferase n=1 Tax=Marinobacter sp. VGCF2001 TaxID=3417189 RepID=UPI003CEBA1BE